MARYYSTFDGSTVAGLEADTAGKRFLRIAMSGDGAALKQALIDQRVALDAAVRSQISTANNNGNLGTVVPSDKLVRGASDTTGTLYTNPAAVYNSDPMVRPSADITSANSTIIAGAPAIVIPNATLDAARAAVNNAALAAGVYDRLGNDAAKTLRTLNLDEPMTRFAWDTFTPADLDPDPLTGATILTNPANPVDNSKPFGVDFSWQVVHPQDQKECVADWTISMHAIEQIGTQGSGTLTAINVNGSTTDVATRNASYLSAPTVGIQGGFRYRITCTVQLRYVATGVTGRVNTYYKDIDVP